MRNITEPRTIDFRLVYSPENEYLQELVTKAAEYLGISTEVTNISTSSALQDYLFRSNYVAGIEFDDSYSVIFYCFRMKSL